LQIAVEGRLPHNVVMSRPVGRVAPRFLDPILAVVERIDRAVRRIEPLGPESVLGIERHRHRGAAVTLADGTVVHPGDPAWIIHFDNARMRRLARTSWAGDAWRVARRDLHALAALQEALPPRERPVAYTGITVLAPLPRRAGFEVFDRPRTPGVRLEDWYLRSVLARWARGGRDRLAHGHRPLVTQVVWLSGRELLRRFGSSHPAEQ
jgi:hypothetical protein